MTFTELIAEIKWESKLEQDVSWDTHLLLLIWDEMVQIASLQNEASLYISNDGVGSISQDPVTHLIALPPLIKLDRVEFLSTMGNLWLLPDRNSKVAPIPEPGKPRAYEIVQGTPPSYKLSLIPDYIFGLSDTLLLSYWKYPPVPVGGDTIFPSSWIQPLKTNCIRRALIFNASSSDKQADMFSQILAKAEAVSQASNTSLDVVDNEKKSS